MVNKIILALRRHYHCEHARIVMQQNALPYPVYEIDENDASLTVLRRAMEQGAEILITGDVYADSIMNQLGISVVTIRRSKIPFSDAIRDAMKISNRIAIVWRDTDSTLAKKACEGYSDYVDFFPYQGKEELDSLFEKLACSDFRVIIGAGVVNPYAKRYNMAVINVPYDEQDILSAVRLAEHNLHSLEERQEHAEILNTIQDNISEGIISLDPMGYIQTINRAASQFLHLDPRTIHNLSIRKTPLFCAEIHSLLSSFEDFALIKAITMSWRANRFSSSVFSNRRF